VHIVYHYEKNHNLTLLPLLGGLFYAEGGVINKGPAGSPTALKVELCHSTGN